jgi:hypothetical protein
MACDSPWQRESERALSILLWELGAPHPTTTGSDKRGSARNNLAGPGAQRLVGERGRPAGTVAHVSRAVLARLKAMRRRAVAM